MPDLPRQRPRDRHPDDQARIPAGVADGQKIRLKGKGAPGENGGPAGDLYVNIKVHPHKVFGRSGDNLTLTVPVTFPGRPSAQRSGCRRSRGSPSR